MKQNIRERFSTNTPESGFIYGCSVKTDLMEEGANSTLSIAKVGPTDSGNYTCQLTTLPDQPATVHVHVLNGEETFIFQFLFDTFLLDCCQNLHSFDNSLTTNRAYRDYYCFVQLKIAWNLWRSLSLNYYPLACRQLVKICLDSRWLIF